MIQIKFNKKTRLKLGISFLVLLVTVAASLGVWSKNEKIYHIGIISGAEPFSNIAEGFKAKMEELGYIDGKTVIYDLQKTNSNPPQEEFIANKFVEDKVDLIFAFPTETALSAKKATKGTKIPVVFAMAGIEGNNLIDSVRNPGNNVTGVRFPNKESTAMRLEFLYELAPQAKNIYIIYDPDYPNALFALEALNKTAALIGITLIEDFACNVEEYKLALKKRDSKKDIGIDAILLMPDFLNHSPDGLAAIIKFANKHDLPVAGGMDFTADMGAMFSFVPDNIDQGKLAAISADKIFKGTPAGSIPVVTPESRLRLNYKVIKKLGLEVSENLLNRADEIIR